MTSRLELGQWVTIPTTYAGGAKGKLSKFLLPYHLHRMDLCQKIFRTSL